MYIFYRKIGTSAAKDKYKKVHGIITLKHVLKNNPSIRIHDYLVVDSSLNMQYTQGDSTEESHTQH